MNERYFLVYGECVCGWKCACLEGSRWPNCPECARLVMPPDPRGTLPRYGFAATLRHEQDALRTIRSGDLDRDEADLDRERAALYDPVVLAVDRPEPVETG